MGSGSTTDASGAASVKGWHSGTVTISYDSGVDVFPAGMSVTFTYASQGQGQAKGNTGMVVTPVAP